MKRGVVIVAGCLLLLAAAGCGSSSSSSSGTTTEESGGGGPNRSYQGPWALFRLLDDATIQPQSDVRYLLTLSAGGRTARLILEAASVRNPFARNELRSFRCGGG